MITRIHKLLTMLGIAFAAVSCVHVSSDPIEVKPIHIVADINLRIDQKLDDFFAFEDKYRSSTTAPATQQVALPTTLPH
jgi:hypothetical protein